MESRKDLYNKNASEKGVDMVSLDRDTMIRISKNPGLYQDFYKSYGRALNARELYDIAHKKMEDEVYCNLDKADAKGMAEKETMEAAKRRVESLERVKDIVDKCDDGDIVAQSLLEPETYEQVYKPTVETLSQGNAAVKNPPVTLHSFFLKWPKTSTRTMACRSRLHGSYQHGLRQETQRRFMGKCSM